MTKKIIIYADEGVGSFSLTAVRDYFSSDAVTLIDAEEILKSGISEDTDIFVMPGGADKPYAKKLKGIANQKIKNYVENGGIYLGICAGAYYGCAQIEFQKGTENEICEPRELGFFNGVGIGCIPKLAKPYDETLGSASITSIRFLDVIVPVLYWGGCYFDFEEKETCDIIATYEEVEGNPPAIISCAYGQGLAILSGVHFEVSSKAFFDYSFDESKPTQVKLAASLGQKLPFNKISPKRF